MLRHAKRPDYQHNNIMFDATCIPGRLATCQEQNPVNRGDTCRHDWVDEIRSVFLTLLQLLVVSGKY